MKDFEAWQLSSLEKVFLDSDCADFKETDGTYALKGERISYQIAYRGGLDPVNIIDLHIDADERLAIETRSVGSVPVARVSESGEADEFYLRTTPGLYPDVLYPTQGTLESAKENLHSLFITVEVPQDIPAGCYSVAVSLEADGECEVKHFEINVLDAVLPNREMTYTQWFHCDCVADYYGCEVFSEEHWRRIEQFIKTAAHAGIDMLLTPIFTPPLDTAVGAERPTVQLVDVEYIGGEYKFGFSRLKRWIKLCRKCGIEKLEMSHLFTQWGTGCTPKIEVKTENGACKAFGWHRKSDSPEYREFLDAFLPELVDFLKSEGVFENTYFHISDEPDFEQHHELYKGQREMLCEYIPSERIMDAMSHSEFCDEGLCDMPVALTVSAESFIEKGYNDIWAYTCCAPSGGGYSNRFIAMPSGRNRICGFQLYKYNIKGFLHWGYNFYYSSFSRRKINPFLDTTAGEAFPAGDAFSVYPGEDGPIESIRSVVFYEALQDIAACRLLEGYIGREEVLKIINEDGEIRWNVFPRDNNGVLDIRKRINERILKEISK